MLDQGADGYNEAMVCAVLNDHLNIVELMLEKGASNFNWVMACAAAGGHLNICS